MWFACMNWLRVRPRLVKRKRTGTEGRPSALIQAGLGHSEDCHYPEIHTYRLSDQSTCLVDGIHYCEPLKYSSELSYSCMGLIFN